MQETTWGSYSKRGKVPHGEACSECLTISRIAYPTKSWDALVLRSATDPTFASEFEKSKDIYGGKRGRDFVGQSFATHAASGIRCERAYIWMGLQEFQKRYACQPGDLGLAVDTLDLGAGMGLQKGICMIDNESPIRIIKYHDVAGRCADEFLSASEALREGQGAELSTWYQENVPGCHHPRCFSKPSAALCATEIAVKAAEFCKEQAERAEEARIKAEALKELEPEARAEAASLKQLKTQ